MINQMNTLPFLLGGGELSMLTLANTNSFKYITKIVTSNTTNNRLLLCALLLLYLVDYVIMLFLV